MYCTHKSSMLYNILGILTLAVLVLTGCSEPEIEVDDSEDFDQSEAVYFETIGQGSRASFDERTELIVKDAEAWELYKEKIATVIPIQDVDFSQLMIAFAAVPSPNGGVTIQFESAENINGELILSYLLGIPGPDCRIIDTPSVPFQAVLIRKIDLPVRFEYREELQYCTLE